MIEVWYWNDGPKKYYFVGIVCGDVERYIRNHADAEMDVFFVWR